ncbi:MAG: M23 family metallopeptidase [Clostridia bacterium]|nr:M23 family metallopeptidase [Clostridia bacterium]
MTKKTKNQNTASGGLYIALAICILSVICIGVYSAIINIFDADKTVLPPEGNDEKAPTLIVETPKVTTSTKNETNPKPETDVSAPDTKEPEQNVNATPQPPSYTLPVAGDVMKEFSNDVLVYSETMNDYRVHNGVDLAAAVGTQVKAFTDGVVEDIYEDPLMGYTVILSHGDETKSIYQNLSSELVSGLKVGSTVKEGDVIAGVGESNLIECAQGPHLHFEVTVNGKYVDPMTFFQ